MPHMNLCQLHHYHGVDPNRCFVCEEERPRAEVAYEKEARQSETNRASTLRAELAESDTLLHETEADCRAFRAEVEALKTQVHVAAGMLSTTPGFADKHPIDALAAIQEAALAAGRCE